MKIFEIREADADIFDGINTLMPQLSKTAPKLTDTCLQKIISSEGGSLIVAMDHGEVLGCVTLSVFPVLTDIRGWIDDLVVRSTQRGRGIGGQLVRHAMQKAKAMGARSVNLTCNPHRESANALYRKMGFRQRETHVYHRKT